MHQGLALSVALLPKLDLSEPGRNLVLAPDQINDPHNLGAILRSAAAFEVRAGIIPSDAVPSSAAWWPRRPPGRVPVFQVVNLARALDELAALGCWRVALDAHGDARRDARTQPGSG